MKDHAKRWTILKRTVQNCKMSKKCNYKHIDLSDNFLSDQVKILQHHYDSAEQDENDVLNSFFIIFRDFHAEHRRLQVLTFDQEWCFADVS